MVMQNSEKPKEYNSKRFWKKAEQKIFDLKLKIQTLKREKDGFRNKIAFFLDKNKNIIYNKTAF